MDELLRKTERIQRQHASSTSKDHQKHCGQVFTPPEVAKYMAGLFREIPREFRLLDPGAGVGILTAAVCERVLHLKSPRLIHVDLFELDPDLPELIHQVMGMCQDALRRAGHTLEYRIHQADFISTASSYFDERSLMFSDHELSDHYDGVIMNPPYFKVRKESAHAKLMERIVHGQPNAYAFFLALAARLLRDEGEMVAITPRSFCSGLYFRGFRQWFFDNVSLDHIHSFESRTDTFREAGVLQESIITKTHRLGTPSENVGITHSWGKNIEAEPPSLTLPQDAVVCGPQLDHVVKIPVSEEDVRIMGIVESLPQSFSDSGLRISTGPVVMFRCIPYLNNGIADDSTVPLLLPHNVKPFTTIWPVEKKAKPVAIRDCPETRSIVLPAENYVLLKRFSAKEEKRRLTAGCFLCAHHETDRLGIENHLNYIYHAQRKLSEEETLGIAAYFNSALLDRYFRIISGNTQVNATEIRNLRFPPLEEISRVGEEIMKLPSLNMKKAEKIVLDVLGLEELAGLTA